MPPSELFARFYERWQRLQNQFPDVLLETVFVYRVALFTAFLTDMLSATLLSRPEMLKSGKTLSYEEIVELPDRAAVIDLIVQRELTDFSDNSVQDQARWIYRHLGLPLFTDDAQLVRVNELSARWSLFVHTNGIVDQNYLKRVPQTPHTSGERLTVTNEYWARSDNVLTVVSSRLLEAIGRQFCANE
jgi:hypothetical protein